MIPSVQVTPCLLIFVMADVVESHEQLPKLAVPTPESVPVQIEVLASELNVRPEELSPPAQTFPYAPYLQERPRLMPNVAKYFKGTESAQADEQSSDASIYDDHFDQFEKDLEYFPWLAGRLISHRRLPSDD